MDWLEGWNPTWRADATSHLIHKLADRITELEAENARLRDTGGGWSHWVTPPVRLDEFELRDSDE
jgi:hypothetical protein